jgi:hypothetical protein
MNLRLALVALVLAPSVGCTWVRENMGIKGHNEQAKGGSPMGRVSAEHLVGYLNAQADRLQSVSYAEATVSAREGWKPLPVLRGNLAAAQPRHFRMVAEGGAIAAKVDMGSNPDLFWVSVRVPTQQPLFVYASHNDFDTGKARLPGGMPFEPEWVMQAMGMTRFPMAPETGSYSVAADERARTYTLSWPAKTPGGLEVRKEIVFAADDADSRRNQPQVKRHVVRDMKGKVICSAEVKAAKTFEVGAVQPAEAGGAAPQRKRVDVAQYPTEVELRWEEQKFEMTLKLDGARVNQSMSPEDTRRLFDLPNQAGVNPINLAEARFEMPRR